MHHFNSLGEIAHHYGVPLHRIQYVVRSRNILPELTVGGRNLYSDADAELIATVISEVDEHRAALAAQRASLAKSGSIAASLESRDTGRSTQTTLQTVMQRGNNTSQGAHK